MKTLKVLPVIILLIYSLKCYSQKSVKIGNQEWMVENLNVTKFSNGDKIPEAETAEEWKKANDAHKPAWCYYNGNPANGKKYGKLYNWYAFYDTRGLAPKGWHIAGDDEWTILVFSLGGYKSAGNKLKNTNGWNEILNGRSGNGDNSSGFSALPGGMRAVDGTFYSLGAKGFFWSGSEPSEISKIVNYLCLDYDKSEINRDFANEDCGFSCRCIKGSSLGWGTGKLSSVKIGGQIWMGENMNVSVFSNGDTIPEAESEEEWEKAGMNGKPAWCYYNEDPANGRKFGKLYNWYAIHDNRGLAPKGWHLPANKEWDSLNNYLGGIYVAGNKLKSVQGWNGVFRNEDYLSGNGDNSSGFSAFPAGYRFWGGEFEGLGSETWFSSVSSEEGQGRVFFESMSCTSPGVMLQLYDRGSGFSVRCIKD